MEKNLNLSSELNEVLGTIYRYDPRWHYQLNAVISMGEPEAEIWKRISEARRSKDVTRVNAYNAVAAVVASHLGNI